MHNQIQIKHYSLSNSSKKPSCAITTSSSLSIYPLSSFNGFVSLISFSLFSITSSFSFNSSVNFLLSSSCFFDFLPLFFFGGSCCFKPYLNSIVSNTSRLSFANIWGAGYTADPSAACPPAACCICRIPAHSRSGRPWPAGGA